MFYRQVLNKHQKSEKRWETESIDKEVFVPLFGWKKFFLCSFLYLIDLTSDCPSSCWLLLYLSFSTPLGF